MKWFKTQSSRLLAMPFRREDFDVHILETPTTAGTVSSSIDTDELLWSPSNCFLPASTVLVSFTRYAFVILSARHSPTHFSFLTCKKTLYRSLLLLFRFSASDCLTTPRALAPA